MFILLDGSFYLVYFLCDYVCVTVHTEAVNSFHHLRLRPGCSMTESSLVL